MEIYNYLASYYNETYGIRGSNRSDAHKKSELRNVCKQIASINKKSPIYKINLSAATQCYAIDIKELARDLKGSISNILSDPQNDQPDLFEKKHIFSSNPNALNVKYVGAELSDDVNNSINIEVSQLASPQINTGAFLASQASSANAQTYSFYIDMENLSYEFDFYAQPYETNESIQTRMANMINRADIGITASVLEDGEGHSAIELVSDATGIPKESSRIFKIRGGEDENSKQLIHVLGIDEVRKPSTNATFIIDGQENSSRSNHFTLDGKFDITLHEDVMTDGPVTIGFHTDVESIASDIKDFFSTYNNMVTFAKNNQVQPSGSRMLQKDLGNISRHFANELEPLGLNVQEDGTVEVDDALLYAAISEDNPKENFSALDSFTKALSIRTNHILLDPIHYVDKLLVSYPNPSSPERSSFSPYHTSYYSGLLFNSYC